MLQYRVPITKLDPVVEPESESNPEADPVPNNR